MRKRRIFLIAFGVFVLLLLVAKWLPRDDGPSYNGQSLYHWLNIEIKTNTDLVTTAQADEAYKGVMQIGTNGLPWLVSCVRRAPGPYRHKYVDLIHKLPPFLNPNHFLCSRAPGQEADYRSGLALEGFRLLGTNAIPALPELRAMMDDPKAPPHSQTATIAIAHLGQPALSTLIPVLTNSTHPQREIAVTLLGSTMWYLGTNAAPAVPALKQCLNDPDPRIAQGARFALDSIVGGRKPNEFH